MRNCNKEGRGRYRTNSFREHNLDMLEEKRLALGYLAMKRKKASALDGEEYLASLTSVLPPHLRFNKFALRLFAAYL